MVKEITSSASAGTSKWARRWVSTTIPAILIVFATASSLNYVSIAKSAAFEGGRATAHVLLESVRNTIIPSVLDAKYGQFCGVEGQSAFKDSSAAKLPELFDFSKLPSRNETCGHCDPEDFLYCCGVCTFEHRLCTEQHPGQNKSQQVLEYLTQEGYDLGQLTSCELFSRIRGRTLWFMGDSQTWAFYVAVECFLHRFAVDFRRRNVTNDPGMEIKLRPVTKPNERWPVCLQLVEGTRVCVIRADTAQSMTQDVFPTLRSLRGDALARDIMVWNIGLHHRPTEDVLGKLLNRAAQYAHANREWLPQLVWMDTPPQHFGTPSGMYTGALRKVPKPWPCGPLHDIPVVHKGGAFNILAQKREKRLGSAYFHTWNATVPLYFNHVRDECTHYCHPGAYQMWIYLFNHLLRDEGLGNGLGVQLGSQS